MSAREMWWRDRWCHKRLNWVQRVLFYRRTITAAYRADPIMRELYPEKC